MNRSVSVMQMIAFGMKAVIGEQQGDKRLTEGAQGGFWDAAQENNTLKKKKKKKKSWQRSRRQIEGNLEKKYMRRSKQALDAESTGHFTRKATYKCNPIACPWNACVFDPNRFLSICGGRAIEK